MACCSRNCCCSCRSCGCSTVAGTTIDLSGYTTSDQIITDCTSNCTRYVDVPMTIVKFPVCCANEDLACCEGILAELQRISDCLCSLTDSTVAGTTTTTTTTTTCNCTSCNNNCRICSSCNSCSRRRCGCCR